MIGGQLLTFVVPQRQVSQKPCLQQCLLRDRRLVTQLCLHIWSGGMQVLLTCPQVMSFWHN
jgi:hypothetical protein